MLAGDVERLNPQWSGSVRVRAQLLQVRGKLTDADDLLGARCSSASDRPVCYRVRVDSAMKTKDPGRVHTAIKDFLAEQCAEGLSCARANIVVGDLLAQYGDVATARTHFERAAEDLPSEESWLRVADAASRSGAHYRAVEALEKVARLRGGADDELRARIHKERTSVSARETP